VLPHYNLGILSKVWGEVWIPRICPTYMPNHAIEAETLGNNMKADMKECSAKTPHVGFLVRPGYLSAPTPLPHPP